MIVGTITHVPEKNLMGVIITRTGNELYFQQGSDIKFDRLKEGEIVSIEKHITLGRSIIRPTEFRKLTPSEIIEVKKNELRLKMRNSFDN